MKTSIKSPKNFINGAPIIQGAKNAALPLIVASTLVQKKVVLSNVPYIQDVYTVIEILSNLGVKFNWISKNVLQICSNNLSGSNIPDNLSRKARGSVYTILTALMAEKKCICGQIGGDKLSGRSIIPHINTLKSFGLSTIYNDEKLYVSGWPQSTEFIMNDNGISASAIALMLASISTGESRIYNISTEPEIFIVAQFLHQCGAEIHFSKRCVTVTGPLQPTEEVHYEIPPDRLVVATWGIVVGLLGGDVTINKSWATNQLDTFFTQIEKAGVQIHQYNGELNFKSHTKQLTPIQISTGMFPQFPTDLAPMMATLCTQAAGVSIIVENIYGGRFSYMSDLVSMGADMRPLSSNKIRIQGKSQLIGRSLTGHGIRETMALTLAGLVSEGITEISNSQSLIRGYEDGFFYQINEFCNEAVLTLSIPTIPVDDTSH